MLKTLFTKLINKRRPINQDIFVVGIDKVFNVLDTFDLENFSYIVNIIKDNEIVLQLIHGGLNEKINKKSFDFNYSISLNFYNEKEKQTKFEELEFSNEFDFYEYENVPSYILNCRKDKTKTKEYLIEIIEKVYSFRRLDIFEFEIHQQPPITQMIPS